MSDDKLQYLLKRGWRNGYGNDCVMRDCGNGKIETALIDDAYKREKNMQDFAASLQSYKMSIL